MDPVIPQPEAPKPTPQILLTLAPDGVNVGVQIQGTTDRALISRMLAAAIVSANQTQAAQPARPRIIVPEVMVNGIRG